MKLLLLLALACSTEHKLKKLSDAEFDAYYALRAYMSEDQREAYLKLKTEDERNAYLKAQGLYDIWYKYSPEQQAKILSGKVAPGWTREEVLLAWGPPYDKQTLAGREAQRSERFIYRFERHEDGTLIVWEPGSKTEYKAVELYRMEVIIDDNKVTEIKKLPRWE